jgi:ribonuclease HI
MERNEEFVTDALVFARGIEKDKMIQAVTDGGANPNPGPAGWGVVIQQSKCFTAIWKAYTRTTNDMMELNAVIAALSFLPAGMHVCVSSDSKYVCKGISEWIHKWKRDGWKGAKKTQVANATLWQQLDSEIAQHAVVQFTWVKAHCGIQRLTDTC